MRSHCAACGWVLPLPPNIPQTWCPCGWRENIQQLMVEAAERILLEQAILSPGEATLLRGWSGLSLMDVPG